MEGLDDIKTVREVMAEKREKAKMVLPVKKSAQKEFIRDFLARHQDKFEQAMDQLFEYDPKAYATIYKDLTKHMIPKQSEVSVTHGLDEDFKELMALSKTKVSETDLLEVKQTPEIRDTDWEELKELDYGTGNG